MSSTRAHVSLRTGSRAAPALGARATAAVSVVAGIAVLLALHRWRGLEYWNYSEGVYALTARLLLRGEDVYGHVVAAQPPWEFLVGAGLLWVHDSLGALRLGLGGIQLATGLLAACAVWRLTASRLATAVTPALSFLTPWALHEHGALTPELVAGPVLLGAVLLSRSERWAPAGAVLAAAAAFVKWPLLIALPAIVVFSAAPRRAAVWALGALVAQALAFTAILGGGLWQDSVIGQLHSGRHTAHELAGIAAQALWSVAGMVALAALAVARSRLARDRALLTALTGLAVAILLTLATASKEGTSLNILVPIEAVLLPLAVAGAVLALRDRGAAAGRAVAGVALAAAFVLAQSLSLLVSSPTATPFTYPTSARGAWGRVAGDAEVRRQAAVARRCPPGVPYDGPPFIAFVAGRRMPDDQPDQFLPTHSSSFADVRDRINAVAVRCP